MSLHKIVSKCILVFIVFSFSACGDNSTNQANNSTNQVSTAVTARSFIEWKNAGLKDKSKEDIMALLGRPDGTEDGGAADSNNRWSRFMYHNLVMNEYTGKTETLYVVFSFDKVWSLSSSSDKEVNLY